MTNKFLDCYYRVSTKGQKEEGYSLDSQIEISQRVAKQLKLKVRPHNEFSKSATIKGVKRDKFEEIKTLIEQEKIKNLWVVEQERLFRKPSDAFFFKEYYLDEFGVTLYSGENPEPQQFGSEYDNEMFQFRALISGFESKKIRRRSIRGKRYRLEEHGVKGGVPVHLGGTPQFGYRTENKQLVIDEEESKWIKWIFKSYSEGMSTNEIKGELDIQGVKPRRTKTGLWNLVTLQKMLGNESYTGRKTFYDKELKKEFVYAIPQIISLSLYEKVQKKLQENLKNKDNNKKHNFLLDGFLYCECGLKMGNESKTRPWGKTETYYCVSRNRKWRGDEVNDCTNHKSLKMKETNAEILKLIKKTATDSVKLKEMFKKDVLSKKDETSKEINEEKKRLEKKIQNLQWKLNSTIENMSKVEVERLQGRKDEKVVKGVLRLLEEEKEHIEREYEKTRQDIVDADERKEWIDWIGKYGDSLETRTSTDKKKKEFIDGLLRRIIVKGEYTKNRDGKLVQLGHSFDIQFKMKIVNDKLEYYNLQNKSDGYKIIEGKSSKKTPIIDVMSGRGQPKKKEGRNLKKQVKTVLTSSVTVE